MEDIILSFTIILSFIGISISIAGLIFAIIQVIKAIKIEKQEKLINEIKEILIESLVLIGDDKTYKGKEALNLIMKQYNCDEFEAVKIYYRGNNK